MAPEVLQGKYNEKCDLWSAGIILYIMICGYPPFEGESNSEILNKIKTTEVNFSGPGWEGTSDEVRDLISRLLQKDPSKRISAEECLKHAWF